MPLRKGFPAFRSGSGFDREDDDADILECGVHPTDRNFRTRGWATAAVRRGRDVMDFRVPGPVAGRLDRFVLRYELVGKDPPKFPDLVQKLRLGRVS